MILKKTPEIDPADPIGSSMAAPLRTTWLADARDARDQAKVVVDFIGEGRGLISIPVIFDSEEEARDAMTPALDLLVRHCTSAGNPRERPLMVDLQELRERMRAEIEEDWIAQHSWFHQALESRELLCMYLFSPSYLLEFACAIGERSGMGVTIADFDPGLYELKIAGDGQEDVIVWNWARAVADVIAGGHAWSYFGMLLALAPTVAKAQKEREAGRTKREGSQEE